MATKRKNAEHLADVVFTRLSSANPEPKTELDYTNAFTLLVAIALSAQATDASVNKATPALFKAADTPEKMAALGEAGIKRYISSIGLYNAKAKNVAALSRKLVEEFGGQVPRDFDALIQLPGVGRKTAHVWLNCLHGEPVIAVDTHVQRVANRIGLCRTKTADQTADCLMKVVPNRWKVHAHHWLILHGRYICKARKPECYRCPVYDVCGWPEKEQFAAPAQSA